MRTGFFARTRNKLFHLAAVAFAIAGFPWAASAQAPYGDFGQSARQQASPRERASQAIYNAPGSESRGGQQAAYDAHGNPLIVQTQYGDPMGCNSCGCGNCGGCDGGCYGGCDGSGSCGCYGPHNGYGGFNGPMPMGAGGTDPPVGYDLMNDVGVQGDLCDQRGPHFFDVRAEAVYLHRDTTFDRDIDFTALNVGNTVVLNSRQLDFEDRTGFRVIGRYDVCPMAVVEFGYTGIFDWSDQATVTDDAGNLYSLFSRPAPGTGLFGVDPAGVNVAGGPNPESERAVQQTIYANSDLQSAEMSYRRYWLGYSPRISGTLLAGFRYTRLDDNFLFATSGSEPATAAQAGPFAELRYRDQCENNLAGFQTGADAWISLTQGLRVGSEGKVGIYNNHWLVENRITTTPYGTTPPSLVEKFKGDHIALLAEASVDAVADLMPSVSLRAGYEVLFMNSLALAAENFNETSPYGNQGIRVPFFDNDGQLFYHGAHVGLEYVW